MYLHAEYIYTIAITSRMRSRWPSWLHSAHIIASTSRMRSRWPSRHHSAHIIVITSRMRSRWPSRHHSAHIIVITSRMRSRWPSRLHSVHISFIGSLVSPGTLYITGSRNYYTGTNIAIVCHCVANRGSWRLIIQLPWQQTSYQGLPLVSINHDVTRAAPTFLYICIL